ncbi:hypothetical protein HJC23_011401 [Cyclotella cryptica]|uniref:Uncharacterized protein n=1 Tax=Cyclotella cryptica TaxID=29204 RepID=A0ABD3PPD8_9STRA
MWPIFMPTDTKAFIANYWTVRIRNTTNAIRTTYHDGNQFVKNVVRLTFYIRILPLCVLVSASSPMPIPTPSFAHVARDKSASVTGIKTSDATTRRMASRTSKASGSLVPAASISRTHLCKDPNFGR